MEPINNKNNINKATGFSEPMLFSTNTGEQSLRTVVENPSVPPMEEDKQDPVEPFIQKQKEELNPLDTRNRKHHFSGASKRRIAVYIRDGMSPQEAREYEKKRLENLKKCMAEATPSHPQKRERSEGIAPNSGILKRMTTEDSVQNRTSRNTSQTYPTKPPHRDPTTQTKVAIAHGLHPDHKLSEFQMGKIKVAIMDEMDKLKDLHPQFTAASERDGWISVTCNNKSTKDWVTSVCSKIKPWEGCNIKVLDWWDIPKPHVCIAYVPKDETTRNLSKEKFLSRIAKQNPELQISSWRILRIDKEMSGGTSITFSTDDSGLNGLRKVGFRIFFNFFQITVRVKGKKFTDVEGRAGPSTQKSTSVT
ncbi:uncharacterized protein LOC129615105 [Condylostylus longicornis]|uniref:uncharacterized protein LOC129615105 n=1 Tax=Condylostylus longicornis TaxID=2530218 RepID=UPI00244DA262|nr:uncharacterized protein LOC129615105 [Condylostylus longicornis]XP_055386150.1 uncharacterized protein LOC129615105 [Condylostylus longicornis]